MTTCKADVDSLCDDTQGTPTAFGARLDEMFAGFEARMLAEFAALKARQARATLAAALFIVTHGISTGIIIAVLG